LQHLANVASGELLQIVRFWENHTNGARRRPKVLMFDKWRALARNMTKYFGKKVQKMAIFIANAKIFA